MFSGNGDGEIDNDPDGDEEGDRDGFVRMAWGEEKEVPS